MEFVWDEDKAQINVTKHGVSFTEAQTAFADPLFVSFYDPDHSDDEERFLMLGVSHAERLLFVTPSGTARHASSVPAKPQNASGATTKRKPCNMNTALQETDDDDLRPEYNIKSLRVRARGPGRTALGGAATVTLAPDVAAVFGTEQAVNEALRFLIKITRDSVSPPA